MAKKSKRAPARRGTYRRYTVKERQAAVGDVATLGLPAAAAKHGVPPSTLWRWSSPAAQSAGAGGSAVAKKGDVAAVVAAKQAVKRQSSTPGVVKRYTPSERAKILEYAAAHSVTEAHAEWGVSRFTINDWKRKVKRAAEGKCCCRTLAVRGEA